MRHYPKSRVTTKQYVSGASGIVNIGPEKGRLSVWVSNASNTAFFVYLGSFTISDFGLRMAANTLPIQFTREYMGDGIDGDLTLVAAVAAITTFTVTVAVLME